MKMINENVWKLLFEDNTQRINSIASFEYRDSNVVDVDEINGSYFCTHYEKGRRKHIFVNSSIHNTLKEATDEASSVIQSFVICES